MSNGTAVAERAAPPQTIAGSGDEKMLDFFTSAVGRGALPAGMNRERIAKAALIAVQRDPDLVDGWSNKPALRKSMALALIDAAQKGLEPDGRRAALVRYKDTVTLQIMVWGLLELVRRSREIKVVDARIVYDGDEFDHFYNPDPIVLHRPAKERGAPVSVYAYARLANGDMAFEPMTKAEVYAIRGQSQSFKKNSGPWITNELEMWRKTALKRLFKRLPQDEEFRDLIDREDAVEFGTGITEPDPTLLAPVPESRVKALAGKLGGDPEPEPVEEAEVVEDEPEDEKVDVQTTPAAEADLFAEDPPKKGGKKSNGEEASAIALRQAFRIRVQNALQKGETWADFEQYLAYINEWPLTPTFILDNDSNEAFDALVGDFGLWKWPAE